MEYRFSYRKYSLPLRMPLRTAHGLWTEREGLLLRLEDEKGAVGLGEVAPIEWFGTESLAEAEAACRALSDKVTAASVAAVPLRLGCMHFALTQALTTNESLISDKRLPVAALLPAGQAAVPVIAKKLEAGFLAFKWKVGVESADEELAVLDDLLAQLPNYARLRLDANGAWPRRTAERWLARCAERPIEFIEQPVAPDDADMLLGLANDYPVTLALDESVTRLSAAREWQSRGWRGVFVIKPALAGPLPELVEWVKQTKADVVLSSAIETALGRMAVLRAALSEPLTTRALGFGVGEIFGARAWDGPMTGPLIDASWCNAVNPEELWNELS